MQHFIFSFLTGLGILSFGLPALAAKDFTEKYTDVNLQALTEFSAQQKTIKLDDAGTFDEYLMATNCQTYMTVKNNQFEKEKLRQQLNENLQKEKSDNHELYFRIPMTFLTSGYNFNTQSFSIIDSNQLHRVNILELAIGELPSCDSTNAYSFVKIPALYKAKLNFPVSLRRIPLEKNMAEALSARLDHSDANESWQIIYGTIFLQIEAIQPQIDKDSGSGLATLRGQVNAIDLYLDQDRKILIKRLNYAENY